MKNINCYDVYVKKMHIDKFVVYAGNRSEARKMVDELLRKSIILDLNINNNSEIVTIVVHKSNKTSNVKSTKYLK